MLYRNIHTKRLCKLYVRRRRGFTEIGSFESEDYFTGKITHAVKVTDFVVVASF